MGGSIKQICFPADVRGWLSVDELNLTPTSRTYVCLLASWAQCFSNVYPMHFEKGNASTLLSVVIRILNFFLIGRSGNTQSICSARPAKWSPQRTRYVSPILLCVWCKQIRSIALPIILHYQRKKICAACGVSALVVKYLKTNEFTCYIDRLCIAQSLMDR
jgi:hypothetical protein